MNVHDCTLYMSCMHTCWYLVCELYSCNCSCSKKVMVSKYVLLLLTFISISSVLKERHATHNLIAVHGKSRIHNL